MRGPQARSQPRREVRPLLPVPPQFSPRLRRFYTPEEYFEGRAPQPFEWGTVAPQSILDNAPAELYRTVRLVFSPPLCAPLTAVVADQGHADD